MNHMFSIIHGISPAYLKEDISLQDNVSHQARSVTSLSYQTQEFIVLKENHSFILELVLELSLPFSLNIKYLFKKSILDQLNAGNQQSYIEY